MVTRVFYGPWFSPLSVVAPCRPIPEVQCSTKIFSTWRVPSMSRSVPTDRRYFS